jgi:hypothetical protein
MPFCDSKTEPTYGFDPSFTTPVDEIESVGSALDVEGSAVPFCSAKYTTYSIEGDFNMKAYSTFG